MTQEYKGPGLLKRFVLGAALVIVASASATSVAAFREVDKIVEAVGGGDLEDEVGDFIATAETGEPQTILLIGSDRRARGAVDYAGGDARSDTIILMRLDPERGATALLSLPRDLKVRIPGHGVDKINAAFSLGGPRLTVRTVKEVTGLAINHVINVDFGGFREAINEIGCVYMDIDRRYFNDNTGPGPNYATIDLKPGYQRLCGQSALDFARFRHEDNDIVRAARQQDLLRQAKAQVPVEELVRDRDDLLKIFGEHTSSDIRGRGEVISLLKLVAASASNPIQEVHFTGELGASYVEASDAQIRRATEEFLGVESTPGPRGELAPGEGGTNQDRPRRRRRPPRNIGLEDATGAGREQAVQAIGAGARFPVFYPTRRTRRALFAGEPRVYGIRAPDGRVHNAYRMVIKRGLVGEYYGVQGTTWLDPPVLDSPSEERKIGGRTYELHYDGDRLRLVAWRTRRGVYWVSNTLLQTIGERQMLAIARSARTL